MPHQDEDVLHASCMELFYHLWEVSKSPGVEGEYPPLVWIVQVIPLHILTGQKGKIISGNKIIEGDLDMCN